MATASRIKFKLATLQEKAVEIIDFRILEARRHAASFEDDEALTLRVQEWRARQEAKISDVFRQLGVGGIDDEELATFRLDPIPEVNKWDRQQAERKVHDLEIRRHQITAKSEALVPDEDGNISLTRTQLEEFFGL
jgi:hypothetical protein